MDVFSKGLEYLSSVDWALTLGNTIVFGFIIGAIYLFIKSILQSSETGAGGA